MIVERNNEDEWELGVGFLKYFNVTFDYEKENILLFSNTNETKDTTNKLTGSEQESNEEHETNSVDKTSTNTGTVQLVTDNETVKSTISSVMDTGSTTLTKTGTVTNEDTNDVTINDNKTTTDTGNTTTTKTGNVTNKDIIDNQRDIIEKGKTTNSGSDKTTASDNTTENLQNNINENMDSETYIYSYEFLFKYKSLTERIFGIFEDLFMWIM